jgi:hypothetical protein
MKHAIVALLGAVILSSCAKQEIPPASKPVPFTAVHINGKFWAPKIEINRCG